MNNSPFQTKVFDLERPRWTSDVLEAQSARHVYEPEEGQQEFTPRMMTGSQAKTAFAIRFNAEKMIQECGLESVVLWTLTVGDTGRAGNFQKVFCPDEASRRWNNLNRRIIPLLFEKAIVVTERHADRGIHFHVLGVLKGRPDVRTGFDHRAVKRRDYRSASAHLRGIWRFCRETMPKYGFGRAEMKPVEKTGKAISSYVSKYIEKNVCNRLKSDKGRKLVRYIGWKSPTGEGTQLKPNNFAWASQRATAWRLKTKQTAALIDIQEPEQAYEAFGPRWAWHIQKAWEPISNEPSPGLIASWAEKNLIKHELIRKHETWFYRRETMAEAMAQRWSFSEALCEEDEDYRRWFERTLAPNTVQTDEYNSLSSNIVQNN